MIKLSNVSKHSKSQKILQDVSLEVKEGEIIGLIGPSGSGKSTLLRCMAGIEKYSSGKIAVSQNCKIGMVFQNFNIFNNMSVIQNLCYPQQKVLARSAEVAEGISMHMLKRVKMTHCFNRAASELSGGQKQRVAIARTLCMEPSLLLFDEPTSALDPENVAEVLGVIKEIASDQISMVIASHEIRFVKSIATRMVFMDNGKIEVDTTKDEFFLLQENKRLVAFLEALLVH